MRLGQRLLGVGVWMLEPGQGLQACLLQRDVQPRQPPYLPTPPSPALPHRRSLEALQTESRDCEALMPAALPALEARLGGLEGELAGVERDQLEAEAKHELYKLLEVRTR